MKITTIDAADNWIARINLEPVKKILEYPLFTDARILGDMPFVTHGDCPYQLLNTSTDLDKNVLLPRMCLRVFYHLTYGYQFNDVKIHHYNLKTDFENANRIEKIENGTIIILGSRGSYTRFRVEDEFPEHERNHAIYTRPLNALDATQGELDQSIKSESSVAFFLSSTPFGLLENFELDISEQFAVLLSLMLGIRLKAGAMSKRKEIGTNDLDPLNLGRPLNYKLHVNPSLISFPINPEMPILPNAIRTIDLNSEIKFFHKIRLLGKEDAIAFMRAAKLYRNALWFIESEPSLSWIMLVSAVEAMAKQWIKNVGLTFGALKERYDVTTLLCNGRKYSEKIGEKKGVTKIAFVAFILYHFPEEPSDRPSVSHSIGTWDINNIFKHLLEVYNLRSSALHEGTIFPKSMCHSPLFSDPPAEKAPSILDGGEENRMLICTYEYVVRRSLLKWLEERPEVPKVRL